MKKMDKYSRTAGYLEKIFRELNKDFFEGEIEEPLITIQSTPSAYGHVTCYKVWKKGEDARHELNIGAGTLARPIEEICATIIHEMVHLYNMQKGIQDTSRGGTYHNKKFKEQAEKRAITIDHSEKYGWTITTPTEELMNYIIGQGWEDILIERKEAMSIRPTGGSKGKEGKDGDGETEGKKKTSTRKYVCTDCGTSIRATKEVRVICADCMKRMELER